MPKRHFHRKRKKQRKYGQNHKKFDLMWLELQDVGEDILRAIVQEEKQQIQISRLRKVCLDTKKLGRILNIMENQNMININEGWVILSEKGQEIGRNILRKHEAIESAYKIKNPSINRHKIAHILEHMISYHDIEKIIYTQQLYNVDSIPLSRFILPYATVYRISLKNEKMFYKLIALGIFPGQRIEISCRNRYNLVLTVKKSRFAIDKQLAEQIFVIP
ncbi:MAG: FeoA domain-containing protein [Promethearchaeota archaeon]